jgi:arsenate reductase (glutaredoxin)
MRVRDLLRQQGMPYEELGLDDPKWSDEQLHSILTNRPVVVTPLGTQFCRPSEAVLDILPSPQQRIFIKEDGEAVINVSFYSHPSNQQF